MRTVLKIFLWLLAILGVLALIGISAFGYFIYSNVNQMVFKYSCSDYVQMLESMKENPAREVKKPNVKEELGVKAGMAYLAGYMLLRTGGDIANTQLANANNASRLANEFATLCRAHPQLKAYDFMSKADEVKKAGVSSTVVSAELNADIDKLLTGVTYQTDPTSTILGKILALSFEQQQRLSRIVTPTTVTSTEPAPH
ncbi:MAG: hypothetical protein GC129_03500 [Proteobacteria bacterium]|nr:hypothetical protein [Pseudomonadota bacterium]